MLEKKQSKLESDTDITETNKQQNKKQTSQSLHYEKILKIKISVNTAYEPKDLINNFLKVYLNQLRNSPSPFFFLIFKGINMF